MGNYVISFGRLPLAKLSYWNANNINCIYHIQDVFAILFCLYLACLLTFQLVDQLLSLGLPVSEIDLLVLSHGKISHSTVFLLHLTRAPCLRTTLRFLPNDTHSIQKFTS